MLKKSIKELTMVLEVLHFPNPRLHLKAGRVEVVNDAIKKLAKDLIETMYHYDGIGLAASQVDVQKRMFVVDIWAKSPETRNPMVFINPEIIEKSGQVAGSEGCLSVPGIYETVNRAEVIKVKYLDIDGNENIVEYSGLMAICVQHETDHLDGKVFVEYLSSLKQTFIKKKLKKAARLES